MYLLSILIHPVVFLPIGNLMPNSFFLQLVTWVCKWKTVEKRHIENCCRCLTDRADTPLRYLVFDSMTDNLENLFPVSEMRTKFETFCPMSN